MSIVILTLNLHIKGRVQRDKRVFLDTVYEEWVSIVPGNEMMVQWEEKWKTKRVCNAYARNKVIECDYLVLSQRG